MVTENPNPVPDLGPDQIVCAGDTTFLDAGNFASWNWSNGQTVQVLPVWYSDILAAHVTDSNGCIGSDTIEITRIELPYVNLGPDSSLCAGDSMVFNVSGYQTYYWTLSGEVDSSIVVNSAGPISVIVTDAYGCSNVSTTVNVTVDPLPAVPTIAKGDMEVPLVSSLEAHYQWFLGGTLLSGQTQQQIIPTESGNYQVMVTDTNGCFMISDFFFLDLNIFDEEMFQGISPNGDGVNDHFTIPEIEYYPNNQLLIFNRWGAEVFQRKPYLNEFEGIDDSGNNLPDGTYYYVLDLGNGQAPVKGYFVIHR